MKRSLVLVCGALLALSACTMDTASSVTAWEGHYPVERGMPLKMVFDPATDDYMNIWVLAKDGDDMFKVPRHNISIKLRPYAYSTVEMGRKRGVLTYDSAVIYAANETDFRAFQDWLGPRI